MAGGGKAPVSPHRRGDAGFGTWWGTVMVPAAGRDALALRMLLVIFLTPRCPSI